MQRSVNHLSNTILILANLRQPFDVLKWAIIPKPNSQISCNSFFIRSNIQPDLAARFYNTNGNSFLSPLPEQCSLPYVTFYEKRSRQLDFCNIFSASQIWVKDIILDMNQGPRSRLKARKCGLTRHSINLYPPNGIKRIF